MGPAALGELLEFEIGPSRRGSGWSRRGRWTWRGDAWGSRRTRRSSGPGESDWRRLLGTQSLLVGKVRRAGSPGQLAAGVDAVGEMHAVSEERSRPRTCWVRLRGLGERLRRAWGSRSTTGARGASSEAPSSVQAARLGPKAPIIWAPKKFLRLSGCFAAASGADGFIPRSSPGRAETSLEIGNLRPAHDAAQRAKDLADIVPPGTAESEIALARASGDEGAAACDQGALHRLARRTRRWPRLWPMLPRPLKRVEPFSGAGARRPPPERSTRWSSRRRRRCSPVPRVLTAAGAWMRLEERARALGASFSSADSSWCAPESFARK